MIQNKNYLKNITIIDIFKNFPCTLISNASYLIIHSFIINSSNYKDPLSNIIDSFVIYMVLLSSIDEFLLYLLKDEPKFTDSLRLKFKLIVLLVMSAFLVFSTGIGIFLFKSI